MKNLAYSLSTPFADALPAPAIELGRTLDLGSMPKLTEPVMTFAQKMQEVAEFCRRDPANLSRFIGLVGREYVANTIVARKKEVTEPMPSVTTLTAGQCSVFDNWGSDKRPSRGKEGHYGPRYQATIELWTAETGTEIAGNVNSVFSATAPLLDAKGLENRVNELRYPKKKANRPWIARDAQDVDGIAWEQFGNFLLTLHENDSDTLYGPVFSRSGGTRYYLNHIVIASKIGTPDAVLSVINLDDGRVDFTRFDTRQSNKKALPAKVIAHSRISNRVDLTAWRTAGMQVACF
jgi:hypothetical protein